MYLWENENCHVDLTIGGACLVADNVHFASAAQLVKALTDADIQFRFQVHNAGTVKFIV